MIRALVVEDEVLIALETGRIVEDECQAVVEFATDLAGAGEVLGHGIDLAVLDLNVTGGSTVEFARALSDQNIGFVFVSADLPEVLPADLRRAPFVRKPYTPAALIMALHDAIGR